jgi:hypothetical protein
VDPGVFGPPSGIDPYSSITMARYRRNSHVISYAKVNVHAEMGSLTLKFLKKKDHDPASGGQMFFCMFFCLNLPNRRPQLDVEIEKTHSGKEIK